jgi:heterotetrameric sarcosine oxidase gamma subunit
MLERRSALAAVLDPALTPVVPGTLPARPELAATPQHRMGEARASALLQVAGFRSTMAAVEAVVARETGLMPPPRIGTVVQSAAQSGQPPQFRLFRTGACQHWLLTRGPSDVEAKLRAAIAPAIGALTPLSSARTRLYLEGPRARDILAKGIAVDLAPEAFPVDRFVLTGLDHTPVLLYRAMEDRYEIWAMRTFARTVWDWLADAALEYGAVAVTRPVEGKAP